MPQVIQDLFTAAIGGGSIVRYRKLAIVRWPGIELVTTDVSLRQAQCWARGVPTSGSSSQDREQLLERLAPRIPALAGGCECRGTAAQLSSLAQTMRAQGLDLQAWRVPGAPAAVPA